MNSLSHLQRPNLEYIEQLYTEFMKAPQSVPDQWRHFFEGMAFGQSLSADEKATAISSKELNVYTLIQYYRDYGHFFADLNPLQPTKGTSAFPPLSQFGLSDADLDQRFEVGSLIGLPQARLAEIIARLQQAYGGTISIQVAETAAAVRDWFTHELEQVRMFPISNDGKQLLLKLVTRTEALERFLHTRYVGVKRFSIEGVDALIPMLEFLVRRGTPLGMKEMVIGMAHRGRINVLANFMEKTMRMIFKEFDGLKHEDFDRFDGDVKYHLGFSADKTTPHGDCHVSLAFNPSHLEAICPVVCGMVRAKQRKRKDTQDRVTAVPVLIHGDAAITGQGVVAETLQLSQLEGYRVGGTIHIITDNQVGFTANPEQSRSTPYASDVAKSILAPVIHVNADDIYACVRAADMAIRFRQQFKRDVVINLIGYRRYGHNESDEPAFTQPTMYQQIQEHPTVWNIFTKQLVEEGFVTQEEVTAVFEERMNQLQKLLEETRASPPKIAPMAFEGLWKGFKQGTHEDMVKPISTGASVEHLNKVGQVLTTVPSDFNLHPKLQRLLDTRKRMAQGEEPIDWGMAELLAFGTLILEGTPIRLSGQDCVRGTFSHRHSMFYDTQTNAPYSPLSALNPPVEFCVYNSAVSEMAVLGFEYGNSSSDPTFLTIWEAQFGDFANGAQIIIDQFLTSAENKWYRMSGLVLLLPHGYEGQGPEHSSARLERFLQLCAQDNIQVCNLTTPSQYFHVLRRQMKRDFRKPLIIMAPKSLLRHPKARSPISELSQGHFSEMIDDVTIQNPSAVKHISLCTGKIFYELDDERNKRKATNHALIRVEQIYPFAEEKLHELFDRYPHARTVSWVQEEPKNMGAWTFIRERMDTFLEDREWEGSAIQFIGRTERASPATGSHHVHEQEQKTIVTTCFESVEL